MKYAPSYEFKEKIERSVHEHEILLACLNDLDVAAFLDWFSSEGNKMFTEWLNTNIEDYNS